MCVKVTTLSPCTSFSPSNRGNGGSLYTIKVGQESWSLVYYRATSSEWNPSCWIYVNKTIAWATFFTSVSAIVWRKVGHLELLVGTDISSHINQREIKRDALTNCSVRIYLHSVALPRALSVFTYTIWLSKIWQFKKMHIKINIITLKK